MTENLSLAAPPHTPAREGRHPLVGKTTRTALVMVLCLAVPYALPARFGKALRIVPLPFGEQGESDPTAAAAPAVPAPELHEGEATLGASDNVATVTNALPTEATPAGPDPTSLKKMAGAPGGLPIEDPSGHALDAFYAQLARTLKKDPGAVTRVLHYGDSLVTADYISGTMRRRLQERFGDAGHGFILIANPIDWYFHNDVVHKASAGWMSMRIVGPLAKDGMYGLGGATFHSTGGAEATVGTADKGKHGRNVSRFDVYYLEHEQGGRLQLTVKGQEPEIISTKGPKKTSRIKSVTVPDGAATLTIRAAGGGDTRLFGVVLERDVPGVTYDALGLAGGRAALWEPMDAGHWAEQFALRKPSLIVLNYGTNESELAFVEEQYTKTLGEALDKIHAAAPDASILVLAPVDRASKNERGEIKTLEVIPKIVEAQRKVASAHRVAFWNTFEAMGGRGTVRKWLHTKPNLYNWDYTHPTTWGAEVIGDMFAAALIRGYQAYAATHPDAPKTEDPSFGEAPPIPSAAPSK